MLKNEILFFVSHNLNLKLEEVDAFFGVGTNNGQSHKNCDLMKYHGETDMMNKMSSNWFILKQRIRN